MERCRPDARKGRQSPDSGFPSAARRLPLTFKEADPINKPTLRVNDKIRAKEVRLVDANGTQLGLVPYEEALDRARKQTLDLVEVSPESSPPVCKIMDYARYLFEAKRRLKESRKKAKTVEMKEIKLRPKIDPHDYSIKISQIREFIEKGHKVKVTMRYRQYEMRQFDVGTRILDRLTVDISDVAEPDAANRNMDGARMQTMILQGKKKGGAPAPTKAPATGGQPPPRTGGSTPPKPGA